jgi:hypothetical protein
MKLFSLRNIISLCIFFFIPDILHASEIFTVQAGAFSLKNNAQNLVNVLENHGIKCTMYDIGGLNKIYCGEFNQKSEAYDLKKELSSLGYDAFVVSKIAQSFQDSIKVNSSTKQSPYPKVTPPLEVAQTSPEKADMKHQEQNPKIITPHAPILLDRVVAVVNKEVITWSELYKVMEFEATTQIKNLSEEERKKLFKESEAVFLENLIDMRLQLQEARSFGLEVTQDEIKETIENIQKKYSMTQTDFIESLKKEGLSIEDYQKRLSEQILINKVVNYQIRNKIDVSDAEVKRYIETNKVSAQNIDKVREDVRKQLTEEQFSEKYRSWIKGLREKAYIEIH